LLALGFQLGGLLLEFRLLAEQAVFPIGQPTGACFQLIRLFGESSKTFLTGPKGV
jgi:hypothetical protein